MADYKATATLPPAANWYSANILAAGPGGWLAWGAKNSLVLLHDGDEAEAGDTEGGFPRVITHHEATSSERGKVTAVAWCPQLGGAGRDRAQLVSGAEDGALTSWRLDTERGQLARCGHTAAGMGRVTSLSWSAADPGLVLAAGETGGSVVTVWDLVTGTASQATYGKQMVFSVGRHRGPLAMWVAGWSQQVVLPPLPLAASTRMDRLQQFANTSLLKFPDSSFYSRCVSLLSATSTYLTRHKSSAGARQTLGWCWPWRRRAAAW